MKLRIRGNSIRLRLTQSEVQRFSAAGIVEERLSFGPSTPEFNYSLEAGPHPELAAAFSGGGIRVMVPKEMAESWVNSEEVGMRSSTESVPAILVEKDFACLTARDGENEDDAFPNPNASDRRE